MTVEEPRARVVSEESDSDVVVRRVPNADDVANHGVIIVVVIAASTTDDVEIVPVQVKGMLPGGKWDHC